MAITLFNDNGAWCWYQDERVLVDDVSNTLLIASVACSAGVGGPARAGDVDVTTYHLDTGKSSRFVLHHNLLIEDDHNTAALLIRPDGRYLAMYTRHNEDRFSFCRVSTRPHDATAWEPERTFDWTAAHQTAGSKSKATYSNLHYLAAEKRTYNFARAINDDPSFLISADMGDTWTYGGKLLTEPKLGYVNGYTRYCSNGIDRIDFITTDHHPRDFNNNIYHGFIGGCKLHRSDGTVVDKNLFNNTGLPQQELTKIFTAGSIWNGEPMTRAWTMDIHTDRSGNPVALISCRANDVPENTNFEDHRFFYARFDGSAWHVHQLAKAGARLWDFEQDYTGLGCLNPANTNELYISTPIDPRDGSALEFHEIFKGVTADGGATFAWTAITENSMMDNLRPTVPIWDGGTAVLWFRGKMNTSQCYSTQIVGLISNGQ